MRKTTTHVWKKLGAALLAATLAFSGLTVASPIEAQAATKPTKLTVSTSSTTLGSSKTLYVSGPTAYKKTTIKVSVTPTKASKSVKYTNSNKKTVSVSSKGVVTAKKTGTAKVTVQSKVNKKLKKTINFTVKKYVYPTKVTAKATNSTIYNSTGTLHTTTVKSTVTPTSATVKKVTYTSNNKALATVSAAGKVTANTKGKTGTVKITVKSTEKNKSGKYLSATVGIKVANRPVASSVALNTTSRTLYISGNEKPTVTLTATVTAPTYANTNVTWTSSNKEVATVSKGVVTAKTMGVATITAKTSNGKTATCKVTVKRSSSGLGIHDPSVYRDPISGIYYTFGSHMVAAKSTDLIGWSWIANSSTSYSASNKLFTKTYQEEFAEAYAFTMPSGANENVWAPDIIYNTTMKKYCMYVSIVDGSKKCCIAMASSDSPEGPYAYQGMIVCSGISGDIDKTNVASALGMTAEQAAASPYATMGTNSPDCIDATVFYDHSGNLWMVYGSFTTAGGIRLLKLDKKTGLRGTNYADGGTTATSLADSDPYYGLKIANNNGEGPYIQEVKSSKSPTGYYYYLWTSVGGLQSYGGYNMRLVRATSVEGPYYDTKGNLATTAAARTETGLRVIDNYKFSFMSVAYTSCGGNSATDDGNGKTFIQFHQKFANGTEGFEIRTHQTFENEDGWLVTAPFEYNGETIADSYDKSAVVGSYEFIYHRTTYMRSGTDAYDYVESQRLELNADGTVSGAYTGTWTLNGHYISININNQTYKGVVLEQYEQTTERDKVMVFTAIGSDNRTIWGSKMHKSDAEATAYDLSQISVASSVDKDFTLPTNGLFDSTISWTSSNANVIKVSDGNATVTKPDKDTTVTLTATVKRGTSSTTKKYTVKVAAYEISIAAAITDDTVLALPAKTDAGTAITWSSSNEDIINSTTGQVTVPDNSVTDVTLTAVYGTVKKTFPVRVGQISMTTIYSMDYETADLTTAGWTTHGALTSIIDSADGNKFASFTSTGSGPRSGLQNFAIANADLTSTYKVETDFKATTASYSGSGVPTTQIALVSQSNTTGAASNALSESECIIDLRAVGHGVQTFTVNGDETKTLDIPADTWCHMEVTIDQTSKTAFLTITNQVTEEKLFEGSVAISGDTAVKGIYILNGRGGTNVQFDNTTVGVAQ